MKKNLLGLALIIFSYSPVFAQLFLSEVLSNEPNSRTLLEWIEIYNKSDSTVYLGDYFLFNNGDSISWPDSINIAADSYAVLCRRLLPHTGSDCFESYWGDSSGIWGDSPEESYVTIEIPITLPNSEGHIQLLDSAGLIVDQCNWYSANTDGQSLERDDFIDSSSGWHSCSDPTGSTPGRANSQTAHDDTDFIFEVQPRVFSISANDVAITISYTIAAGATITIDIYDDAARKVINILDGSDSQADTVFWRGRDDRNRAVIPGLYILKAKVSGSMNYDKLLPLVIAP